jgi:hypothetical protein
VRTNLEVRVELRVSVGLARSRICRTLRLLPVSVVVWPRNELLGRVAFTRLKVSLTTTLVTSSYGFSRTGRRDLLRWLLQLGARQELPHAWDDSGAVELNVCHE